MGTGGFSTTTPAWGLFQPDDPMGYRGFMVAGVNFALYYEVIHGQPQALWRDEEFRLYLLLIVVATGIITTNITPCIHRWLRPFDTGFQVVSTITSTDL